MDGCELTAPLCESALIGEHTLTVRRSRRYRWDEATADEKLQVIKQVREHHEKERNGQGKQRLVIVVWAQGVPPKDNFLIWGCIELMAK